MNEVRLVRSVTTHAQRLGTRPQLAYSCPGVMCSRLGLRSERERSCYRTGPLTGSEVHSPTSTPVK